MRFFLVLSVLSGCSCSTNPVSDSGYADSAPLLDASDDADSGFDVGQADVGLDSGSGDANVDAPAWCGDMPCVGGT